MIPHETIHQAKAHVNIWHAYTLCLFSSHEKNTDSSIVGWMILLASAGYGDSWGAQHLLQPHLVLQPIWGWGNLGSFQLLLNSSPEGAWNFDVYI